MTFPSEKTLRTSCQCVDWSKQWEKSIGDLVDVKLINRTSQVGDESKKTCQGYFSLCGISVVSISSKVKSEHVCFCGNNCEEADIFSASRKQNICGGSDHVTCLHLLFKKKWLNHITIIVPLIFLLAHTVHITKIVFSFLKLWSIMQSC